MSTEPNVASPQPSPQSAAPARRKRWPWIVGIVALALVVLFYVGGGWFFSGMVYADALKVSISDPAAVTKGVVVAVSRPDSGRGGTLTEQRDAEYADTTKFDKAVVGLKTADGLVVVGPGTTIDGTKVTRPILKVIGTAPEAGEPYGLVRDVWLDPKQAGINSAEISIKGENGNFPAWSMPANVPSTKMAILVHGKGAHRSEMLRMAKLLIDRGFNVMSISYSNDPGTPANDDNMVHFGRTEWKDLDAVFTSPELEGITDVVVGGISHGGAVALGFMAHSPHASKVKALVLEAPATSLRDVIDDAADYRKMPGIGTDIPQSLQNAALKITSARYDIDYDAVDYSAMPMTVPTLILQGDQDKTVPLPVNQRYADAHSGNAELVVFPGADHVLAWNTDPKRYESTLASFLESNGLLS